MKEWLMMVGTNCSDPSKEGEFNDWYDNIDIPDMLKIFGFLRARRYEGAKMAKFPEDSYKEQEAKYLAVYNIESEDIDKTVKYMIEASAKMEAKGRTTPLLDIFDAAIYRQIAPSYEKESAFTLNNKDKEEVKTWIYIVKGICLDPSQEKEFNDWYNNTHVPDIMVTKGFMRVTRYELHRILREKIKIPKFLAIYDIEAKNIEETIESMYSVGKKLRQEGRMIPLFKDGGSSTYLKIADAKR